MNQRLKRIAIVTTTSLAAVIGFNFLPTSAASGQGQDQASKQEIGMQPVEADVHEFMEYAFEPFFHELKASLSEAPKDRKAWKPVKANSLILAENGNLLMLRGPDEGKAAWNSMSAALRDQGKLLYQAAKKREYSAARKQYELFVSKCNACHQEFADGEHILKP